MGCKNKKINEGPSFVKASYLIVTLFLYVFSFLFPCKLRCCYGLTNPMTYETRRFNAGIHNLYFLKSILILSSHLRLGLPKGLFPIGVPVKILKALLPSSILVILPAHLSFLNLITLPILGERYKL